MFAKLVIFAAALILVGPVFAATAGGSGGGSAPSSSGGGGGGHGGGGGGGGHSGGGAGGGGGHGGGSLGGHGASHAIAATASHASAMTRALGGGHSAHDSAGKHVQSEHSTSRVAGTQHHPHPPGPHHRRFFREDVVQQWDTGCVFRIMVDKWLDCFGATKSGHLARPANRS
jgi:hypothetical protein